MSRHFVFFPLVLLTASAFAQTGLREETVETTVQGKPIVRADFEKCLPAEAVIPVTEAELKAGKMRGRLKGCWIVRRPGWTDRLLNAVGSPPDIVYDPKLTDPCDIYLGLRAVSPRMSFGIKLSSEQDFTIITAPAAAPKRHFNYEFHWKIQAPMAGEKIVLRALGYPVYIQYLRFVPTVKRKAKRLVATDHVTICKEKGRHFAFPGVAKLPNGDLAVVCREGVAHVCPFGKIVLIRSRDGGRTWDKRVTIYDSISDDRDPAILTLPDGTVIVTFNTWHSWTAQQTLKEKYAKQTKAIQSEEGRRVGGAWLMASKDNGHTWSKPIRTPTFSPRGPTLGPDGKLYYVGDDSMYGKCVVNVYRSEDGGKTWTRHGEVGYSPPIKRQFDTEVYDEPNLGISPNGQWITTIRVQYDGYVRQSHSKDGQRWTFPKKLSVRGFPQHLLPLRDGRWLMTYGYRFPPMGIRGCLSKDGGKTWDLSREIVFRHEGASSDLGYPYSIELDDGRVLTVYYYIEQDSDCYIEGAFYSP
ncbi:MAG: exo-alpha-sialidase [Planctomycetes bacterium]|nr:exo-alpha-sialidase [Planctomycetota bacterium]